MIIHLSDDLNVYKYQQVIFAAMMRAEELESIVVSPEEWNILCNTCQFLYIAARAIETYSGRSYATISLIDRVLCHTCHFTCPTHRRM